MGVPVLEMEVFELSLTGMYLGGYLIMRQGKIRVPDSLPDRTRKCCGNTFKSVRSFLHSLSLDTNAAQEHYLTIFDPSSAFAGLFKSRIHEYASSLHYWWQGGPSMLWRTSRRSTLPWRTERRPTLPWRTERRL